jgi:glycosidase
MINTLKQQVPAHFSARKRVRAALVGLIGVLSMSACITTQEDGGDLKNATSIEVESTAKPVVYQVFTRLFGNTNTTNKPWGTIDENGVGKFADFTPKALAEIKALGATHIWYTGVLHHALVADYTEYGISLDDPDVVKGRAGSPYAVKDYYNVNPDLAANPANRLAEFEALIARSHEAGLKVIIDIVPNHIARNYFSTTLPTGHKNFGVNDNTQVEYQRDNNFYYIPSESFVVPTDPSYLPLGGEEHPLLDGQFAENPAKWTGNGARQAKPSIHDWYETVKVNYGVKPDGSYDFDTLPSDYAGKSVAEHAAFWQGKSVPDSWNKFRHIVLYWLDKGVDGFRYDMAEMVPVEFWSYLNSAIKTRNPNAFILAEVYNPELYRPYVQLGKMDYLYDKVGFYDNLKWVMQGKASVDGIWQAFESVHDIEANMLHFLENHDEQRIASPEFAGSADAGKPAMVVSHLISNAASMIYFGQTEGEDGSEHAGFGQPSRTSIFDYVGVPAHQAWVNFGKFDGGLLTQEQKALRAYYQKLLNLRGLPAVTQGKTSRLEMANATPAVMAFARQSEQQTLIVVSNLSNQTVQDIKVSLPQGLHSELTDILENHPKQQPVNGVLSLTLAPFASAVYQVEKQ